MPSGFHFRPSRPLPALLALAGPMLLLAACSSSEPAKEERLVCPRPGIVNGLDRTEAYKSGGEGRDDDLRWIATMQNIDGGCSYDEGVTVNLSIDLVVAPGPAYDGQPVDLRYFVAVAGPDGQLVDKQLYTATVTLPPGAVRGGTHESFTQRYANIEPAQGAGYRIYFGFDLPEQEALRRRNAQQP